MRVNQPPFGSQGLGRDGVLAALEGEAARARGLFVVHLHCVADADVSVPACTEEKRADSQVFPSFSRSAA